MPYLLLAIGALMSVAGAYSIITGSHIVQVEAGWTSVIAGATLFAGGILTMALGLVLRVLLQLQKALVSGPIRMPSPALVADDVLESAPPTPEPPPIEYLSAADPVMPPAPLEPALRQEDVPAPARRLLPTVPKLPLKLQPRLDNWRKPKRQPEKDVVSTDAAPQDFAPKDLAPKEDLLPSLLPVPAPVAVAPAEPAAARPAPIDDNFVPADEVAQSSDDYRLETPSTPEHDLGPGLPDIPPPAPKVVAPKLPASPQLEDDWLDRAFAEFDHDLPKNTPADMSGGDTLLKPPAHHQSKTVAPAPEPVHPEPEPNFEPAYEDLEPEPVDVAGAAPATVPEPEHATISGLPPAGAGAAVIGRYESDGTTYVMYADGSIEAQSESGVYRFASMAELKAFIEN